MIDVRARWTLPRSLLLAIVVVALFEWIAAARVYRSVIAGDDWRTIGEAIDALPPDEPVLLADGWIAPTAAMMLPTLARISSAAPPDLREPARVHVLGVQGRSWSSALQADLEDRAPPTVEQTRTFGGLSLTAYTWQAAAPRLASFVDDILRVQVVSGGTRCQGQRTFKCRDGHVRATTVEVGYRARRCVEVDVVDGAAVTLSYPAMALGTVLRGHVGWGDFNRRLRSDAPTMITIRIDGDTVARWVVTDAEGWRALAVATTPGRSDVEIEMVSAAQGTWDRSGYTTRSPHAPCIELRALAEERP